jgi:hypothetical protein
MQRISSRIGYFAAKWLATHRENGSLGSAPFTPLRNRASLEQGNHDKAVLYCSSQCVQGTLPTGHSLWGDLPAEAGAGGGPFICNNLQEYANRYEWP